MSTDQTIAIAGGVIVPLLIAVFGGMWKLASLLVAVKATTDRELNHNGGSSTKDMARDARDDSRAALLAAESANDRIDALDVAVTDAADQLRGLARDLRDIRTAQSSLATRVERVERAS